MKETTGILEKKLQTYYEDLDLEGYRQIFSEAIQEYKGQNFAKVLDIGAGVGSFEDANRVFGYDFYALEASQYGVKRMQEKGLLVTQFLMEKDNPLPFSDGFFSCVIFNQVIEHVEKDIGQYYIEEIIRVLEVGGVAIINSPSKYCRIWRTDPNHIYCWRPNELLNEVKKHSNIHHVKLQRLPLEPWMFFKYSDNIIDYWHTNNKQPFLRKIFNLSGRIIDFFLLKIFQSDLALSVSNISFTKK